MRPSDCAELLRKLRDKQAEFRSLQSVLQQRAHDLRVKELKLQARDHLVKVDVNDASTSHARGSLSLTSVWLACSYRNTTNSLLLHVRPNSPNRCSHRRATECQAKCGSVRDYHRLPRRCHVIACSLRPTFDARRCRHR